MRKTVLLTAIAAALIAPSIAQACMNATEATLNDYVRVLVKAEKSLDAGRFADAKRALDQRFPRSLNDRALDARAVLAIRTNDTKQLESAARRFKAKAESNKDVRFKAWLAEAQLALGQTDEARAGLIALKEADLMPDAFAYRALAMLSTGAERYELYKACRTRAKNKDICELPKAKTSS
jgi:hypothetical protein